MGRGSRVHPDGVDPVWRQGVCESCVEYGGETWHRRSIGRAAGYYARGGRFLHRRIWEDARGPIPEHHHVHHRDGDRGNNALDNLELLSRSEHASWHYPHTLAPHGDLARRNAKASQARAYARRRRVPRTCAHCGGAFYVGSSLSKGRKFCSERCYYHATKPDPWRPEPRRCVECGSEFTATRETHRFCSARCRIADFHKRASERVERIVACAQCGAKFRSARVNARYCSDRCKQRYNHRGDVRAALREARRRV